MKFYFNSIAGEGTSIYLEDYDLALDCGVCVDKLSEVSHFFITHGHFDHIGALCWRARISCKRDLPPPTFYMPSSIQDQVNSLLNAYSSMGNECLANVISIEPDNVIKTLNLTNGKSIKWEVVKTDHTVPSHGYLLYNLNDNIPFLAYTGDTLFHSVKENIKFLKAKILIMELTFLNDIDYERAVLYKHCHAKDIIDNISLFENEFIIFVHPSYRYNVERMKDFVKTLPIEFAKKCYCVYSTDVEKVLDE